MQLWTSEPVGCSGLVVLAAVDDDQDMSAPLLGDLPTSTWVVDQATAELAVEMHHDVVSSVHGEVDVDVDALVERARRATRTRPDGGQL